MEPTRNLCAQVPVSLHSRVREAQAASGLSLSAYITQVLTEYYEGGRKTMEFTKTMAFQVSEDLFLRLKDHLARESRRRGKKLSQKEFVLELIQRALAEADARYAAEAAQTQDEGQE